MKVEKEKGEERAQQAAAKPMPLQQPTYDALLLLVLTRVLTSDIVIWQLFRFLDFSRSKASP